jgi:FAD/FMN-containing dehydrogenase
MTRKEGHETQTASRKHALDAIRSALGPLGWLDESKGMAPYLVEERGLYHGGCALVARPATTGQVAAVVGLCAGAGIPIVPQGGNTGLVGGGVPDGGIVLSTERLTRIREVDALNHTMTVEAGCILADVRDAAREVEALFPLSLAAEGSCRIGGNLSTNAGGVSVLRYGNARDLVLGLEVVLADGRVWDGLGTLRKDNTGYDLKHLFIGAEGTLGIITAAVLKLFVQPRAAATAVVAMATAEAVLDLFARVRDAAGDRLTAFEMMTRIVVDFGSRHIAGVRDPFDRPHPYYALVELTSPRADGRLDEILESTLGEALDHGCIADAVIAASEGQRRDLWFLRESIHDAQKHEGGSIKHDISVPVSKVPAFLIRAERIVQAELPGIRVVAFGHVGDGNIHFNLSQPEGADKDAFLDRWSHFNRVIHDLVADLNGSFSAEHGIGQLKKEELLRYAPPVELDLMRAVKKALDPQNIMNPGKVIDV